MHANGSSSSKPINRTAILSFLPSLSLSIFTIMGCRQSKPNVATGNTVAKSKKSKSNAKRISPPETERDDKSPGLMEAAPVGIEGGVAVMVNGKEGESTQSRDLDRETEGSVKEDEDEEEEEKDELRSISRESPNHYFSSRKDDESVVDAVSVSLSGDERSVYSSPPHEMAGKEVNVFSKETIEEDDAVEETKTETEKKISEEEPEEGVKEENLKKESEMAAPKTEDWSIEEKIAHTVEENFTPSGGDQDTKQGQTLII